MDIHARIAQFLQQHYPHSPQGNYVKAGVVPFLRDPYRFYVMKPVAKHAHLPPPKFQLCKGTRMVKLDGVWTDVVCLPAKGELESLAATALREGVEELGLKLEHIKRLLDMGAYGFSSAATGKGKEMWLFAAEMASDDVSDAVEAKTAARAWLSLAEFEIAGREDHRYILRDIEEKLKG